jgi:anti-sigma regulatory factor (Ser/Thr protein kinase)
LGITEIQMHNNDLSIDSKEALGKIYDSGYLLLHLINDILDLSKIESGKMELVLSKYETANLISDTVQMHALKLENTEIEFKLQITENIPATLIGDDLRIKQILNNLLSNAIKYTHKGSIVLTVDTETKESSDVVILILQVIDTGMGMTNTQVEKLFEKYTRFNMEANRNTEGTGLGMTITKFLAELMTGSINVKSEPDKGSAFTVRIPQKKIDSEVLGKAVVEKLQQFKFSKMSKRKNTLELRQEYMPYGRILVVDDVETNLYVAQGLMMPYGLFVETVTSGIEAIEKIKSGNEYDIIFMDHFMPNMDGIEATNIIRNSGYSNRLLH